MAKKPTKRSKPSKRKSAARAPSAVRILHTHAIARFGWVPDLPDARDLMYSAPAAVRLPPHVDLSPHCPPVYNQGQLGSCTGNAIAAAIQFDRMKQRLERASLVPSRLFIYYNERVIENSVGTDSGAQIRDGIKSVNKLGACYEGKATGQWPYDIDRFADAPPKSCFTAAAKDKALSYSRIANTNLDQLKGCLASGYPFVFGFTVYESFQSPQVARTGVLGMPRRSETVVGGHAVLGVGYDDARKTFLVRNSWGAKWGKKGYFTIPYDYLTNNNLADDFWTIRIVSGN